MDISALSLDSRNTAVTGQLQDANVDRFRTLVENAIQQRANGEYLSEEQRNANRARIREAAQMFEAHFVQLMFREMRRTTFNEDGFFSRNNAENIWTEMFDEVMADAVSTSNGGIGLADMIYRQMTLRYRDEI